jgi:acetylornithine deacetylase/succinyl-diaminopimelate desuccinylase-like protein
MSRGEEMKAADGRRERRDALRQLEEQYEEFKQILVQLSRIPSVSAPGFPPEEVRRSADAFADLLRRIGLQKVQVLEIKGVHPYVYGEWAERPGAPTLLLYGHHDVVPPGRPDQWRTPAFEPMERGGRLYGRGTADDKGGILVHVAAVAAYLRRGGSLPCNVKFLIEGEEEIGSGNLARFLEHYQWLMSADAVVLSDTSNFDIGIPALTYRLRGLCQVDVEVQCLERPVHSGQKGGPVPDAVQILCGLIAGLTAADGSLDIPGLYRRVAKTTPRQRARIRRLPFDRHAFARSAGLLEGVRLAGEKAYSVLERMWTRPSLTVIAFESQPIAGSSNQIVEAARARLSMRTVPDMDSREAGELLIRKLARNPPHDARVEARIVRSTPWWATDPEGPAFEAARRALKAGFGREAAMIGAGGSIGFVQPFADLLKGAPCLLTGVEDPACGAHSENEGLHLGDWKKCMRAAVCLYDELSRPGILEKTRISRKR